MNEEHLTPEQIAAFDAPDRPGRETALAHVRGCEPCRRRLCADEPSRLFALLALAPIPDTALEQVSRRVSAELHRETVGSAARRRWFAVASIAASLFVAAIFLGYSWMQSSETSQLARSVAIDAPASQIASVDWLEFDEPAGQIQLISSPGTAQVLDLTVGDTRVVMIFDEALDI